MAKGIWRREGDHAVPVGAESIEYFQALEDGAEFIAETRGARNLKQLKMWWTLCGLLADNDTEYDTKEIASNGLKLALKHVDTFLDRDGNLHISPASIAFESLTQEAFNPIFKAAIDKVAEWLGNSPAEVQKRFNEITADKRYEGYRR
jgi:hypothetical protein